MYNPARSRLTRVQNGPLSSVLDRHRKQKTAPTATRWAILPYQFNSLQLPDEFGDVNEAHGQLAEMLLRE